MLTWTILDKLKKVVNWGLSLCKGAQNIVRIIFLFSKSVICIYHDNIFVKRSIPTVYFAHMGINPLAWHALLMRGILSESAINKVISV